VSEVSAFAFSTSFPKSFSKCFTLAGAEEPFLFISVNAAPPAIAVAATPRPGLEAPVLAFFTAVVPAPPAVH
jgi:hypothetical protein